MSFSLFGIESKKREQIVSIDLGTRFTKALYLRRRGDRWGLVGYALRESNFGDKPMTVPFLAEHLRDVVQSLGAHTKKVTIAPPVAEALVRPVETTLMPVADLRLMLKHNAKNLLQLDPEDYIFDCYILPPRPGPNRSEPDKLPQKGRVIVGGAKRQLIDDLQGAAKEAGLIADQIVPNLLGPANALESAYPDQFAKEVLAVVDLGFKHTTISLLQLGELKLNRVVNLGGDRLTSGLAEAMNLSYPEAEQVKLSVPPEAEAALQSLIAPLGRELRASLDFFEHQHDATVTQVWVCGAAAASSFMVRALQAELMVPCRSWNVTNFLEVLLPPEDQKRVEQTSSQFAVAIGAASAAF